MSTASAVARLLVVCAASALLLGAGCSKKPKAVTTPPNESGSTGSSGSESGGNNNQAGGETGGDRSGSLSLQDIYFDYDRAVIRDEARNALNGNAKQLMDSNGARVVLEGHCDERGTVEYNLALGERRANAARDYLVRYGIEGMRLSTVSFGEERPFDPGHEESAWSKNRRVHFVRQ